MTIIQAQLILAMADNDMNMAAVAKKFYFNRSSVLYQFDRIARATGKDPRVFRDLVDLIPMAEKVINEQKGQTNA